MSLLCFTEASTPHLDDYGASKWDIIHGVKNTLVLGKRFWGEASKN